jgi:hypothetical protein
MEEDPTPLDVDELVDELHEEDIERLEELLTKHMDFHRYLEAEGRE